MPDLITIISSAGVSAALCAALVFLTKNLISERLKSAIKSEYDQKLETHKAQLKSQHEISLEHFKAQLQISASERNIKLSGIFDKMVEATLKTHELLMALYDSIADYTKIFEQSNGSDKVTRRLEVSKNFDEFLKYYRPKKPLLPKKTVEIIDELTKRMHASVIDFMFDVEQGGDDLSGAKEKRDAWMRIDNEVTKEFSAILRLLEHDVRVILGITTDDTPVPKK